MVQRWQAWAQSGALSPLFTELMALHYDPHYEKSQSLHFAQWTGRAKVPAAELSAEGIDRAAEAVLGL